MEDVEAAAAAEVDDGFTLRGVSLDILMSGSFVGNVVESMDGKEEGRIVEEPWIGLWGQERLEGNGSRKQTENQRRRRLGQDLPPSSRQWQAGFRS